jgi:hypothetical protein
MKNLPLHVLLALVTFSIAGLVAVQWMAIRAGMDGVVLKSTTGGLVAIALFMIRAVFGHLRSKKKGVNGNGVYREK